jgi:hypothetical protein
MVYGRVHESEYNHSILCYIYLKIWPNILFHYTRSLAKPLLRVNNYSFICAGLATVIGVKCMSPGTDGKPKMKAKSFVSDKYKELFEIASLH